MSNRRTGWLQGRIVAFASPMTLSVQLINSGTIVEVLYAEAPLDCRLIGQKVWMRRNKHHQENEIERRH